MMELHTKIHIEGHSLNANGTLKGANVFDYADVTAFSIINDKFTRFHKHIGVVTSSATSKFISPIFGYGFIECFAEIIDCTPARITVKILIKYRERKGLEWVDAFEGTFQFTCIDRETRKVYKLSKEEMNEIKK